MPLFAHMTHCLLDPHASLSHFAHMTHCSPNPHASLCLIVLYLMWLRNQNPKLPHIWSPPYWQTHLRTDGPTYRLHADRHAYILMDTPIYWWINLHTDRHTYILTNTPTYWQTPTYWRTRLHTNRHTFILTDTPTYWQTHLHTDRHTYILTDTPTYALNRKR